MPKEEAWQTEANKKGAKLTVDGVFGSGSATALKNYQKANGLDADGVCGPATWYKIFN